MSRSHTNVTIESEYSSTIQFTKRIAELEFELSYAKKRITQLHDELVNIPRAVEEWGYVDIEYDNKSVTLIAKPVDSESNQ